jgi:hypothetical protein
MAPENDNPAYLLVEATDVKGTTLFTATVPLVARIQGKNLVLCPEGGIVDVKVTREYVVCGWRFSVGRFEIEQTLEPHVVRGGEIYRFKPKVTIDTIGERLTNHSLQV